jgi:hypothetical protein
MSRLGDIRRSLSQGLEASLSNYRVEVFVTTGKTTYDEQQAIERQNFAVIVTCGQRDDGNEELLDELLDSTSPLSVKNFIESNRQPTSAVIDTRVLASSGMRLYPEDENLVKLGAEWNVECLLEGDPE